MEMCDYLLISICVLIVAAIALTVMTFKQAEKDTSRIDKDYAVSLREIQDMNVKLISITRLACDNKLAIENIKASIKKKPVRRTTPRRKTTITK